MPHLLNLAPENFFEHDANEYALTPDGLNFQSRMRFPLSVTTGPYEEGGKEGERGRKKEQRTKS